MTLVNKRNFTVGADVKFTTPDLKPVNAEGWFVITLIPDLAGKLSVIHDPAGDADPGFLNNGDDLVAGAQVSFNVLAPTSEDGKTQEAINFKYSVATVLRKLLISPGA